MKKCLHFLDDHLEEVLCFLIFAFLTALTFLQVVMRYVFHSSITFSEELGRYLFVWLTFIGISYGVKLQKHMSIDAVYGKLPPLGRRLVDLASNLLFLLFTVLAIVYSIQYFQNVGRSAQYATTMRLHMKWVALAPVVGFLLACFRLLQRFVLDFLHRHEPPDAPCPAGKGGGDG